MSKISREESIKWLEKAVPVCACTSSEFDEFIRAVNRAISDMEKLQKVEKIIDEFWGNDTDSLGTLVQVKKIIDEFWGNDTDSLGTLVQVKKIVKEVE